MTIRTKYSSLDMVRMAKFAKENPDLKPMELIAAYNVKYPEVTIEQKLKNIRNWIDDNEIMAHIEKANTCSLDHPYVYRLFSDLDSEKLIDMILENHGKQIFRKKDDRWIKAILNDTYAALIQEFPEDYAILIRSV